MHAAGQVLKRGELADGRGGQATEELSRLGRLDFGRCPSIFCVI